MIGNDSIFVQSVEVEGKGEVYKKSALNQLLAYLNQTHPELEMVQINENEWSSKDVAELPSDKETTKMLSDYFAEEDEEP